MTEVEWLRSTNPGTLWSWHFVGRGRLLARKLRLLAVAVCRRLWEHMRDERSRGAVEVAERYADGAVTLAELQAAHRLANTVADAGEPWGSSLREVAARAAVSVTQEIAIFAGQGAWSWLDIIQTPQHEQCELIREITGNSFRPTTFNPAWLCWDGETITKLALAAYDDRRLPEGTLDPARLAILADASEEAGCTDAGLLGHLRSPRPHVRGCFALDAVLGKS
ncbi:MAG: hypothetical protein L0Z62_31305 [Gemmataceae bacterium]|nr:hypothetical protein [Gemmataceae bacterium]